MHRSSAVSLLPLLHCQSPRAEIIFATSLQLSSTHNAVHRLYSVSLHSSPLALSTAGIASPLLLSSFLAACADREIFAAARCFPASLSPSVFHHFSFSFPRCQCVACNLAPFSFTATRSLFIAAVAALDTAIDAADPLCQQETFCFVLSLLRHSVFSRLILACAHSCFCLLPAAVLRSCCVACITALSAFKCAAFSSPGCIAVPIA